jgi:FkbM family methyltransferase
MRKIFFKISYLVFKLFRVNRFVASYYNVKLTPIWDDQTFKYCYRGDYGNLLSDYLNNLNENFVFVDIGANQGLYSIIAGKNKFSQRIYSIEPQKRILKILENNLKANGIKDYEIIPYALSDKKSKIDLVSFDNHSGKSTLQSQLNQPFVKTEEIETIDSNFIEHIFDLNENYILKIDVEGHEEVVIKELLKITNFNKISIIFYEVNVDWIDHKLIMDLLKKSGFVSFTKIGNSNSHFDVLATR